MKGVEKATVWKLYPRGWESIEPEEEEKVAKEIAEGLLTNPNKDSYEIMAMQKIVG